MAAAVQQLAPPRISVMARGDAATKPKEAECLEKAFDALGRAGSPKPFGPGPERFVEEVDVAIASLDPRELLAYVGFRCARAR